MIVLRVVGASYKAKKGRDIDQGVEWKDAPKYRSICCATTTQLTDGTRFPFKARYSSETFGGLALNSAQFVDRSSCYLCGSEHRTLERELGTREGQLYLRWVRCQECELVYLDPRPSVHALSALYDSQGYWQGDSGYKDYLAEERWRRRQAKDRAHWFAKRLQVSSSEKPVRVLEVGSAAGYFLQELTEHGVEAQGLDLSRPMVRLSDRRTASNVSVRQGSVENTTFPDGHFQGLAVWGCDSNFDDPKSTFEKFGRWVEPGGLLTFNFHDYDHWASLLKGRFKLMPNALYFLNRSHVGALLAHAGFELVAQQTEVCWMNLASAYHHTGHLLLSPIAQTALARMPLKLPVPGSYRVLARKLPTRTCPHPSANLR